VRKQNSVEVYDANKRAEQEARLEELRTKVFFGVRHPQGSYDDGLSTAEIKFLRENNKSFVDTMTTIDGFRTLTPEQQESFYNEANSETRTTLESDGYLPQTLAESPEEAAELLDSRRATEQEKLFRESREAEEAIARNEQIYPGVEKIDENLFRLVVDPGDGSAAEVFQGSTPAETFQKLIESKRHATRELRRRAKSVKITAEMRALTPEIVSYPPLMEKLVLTAEQIYDYTAKQNDPVHSVEAIRMLRLAGMSDDEIARHNEVIVRSRETEARSVADAWIKNHEKEFYVCPENLQSLMSIFENLNWACTSFNLDLALSCLREQGVLVDRPADGEVEAPAPQASPRRVFTPQAAPSAPVAPLAARPTAPVRRPLNNTSVNGPSQTRAREEVGGGAAKVKPMDAVEYASIGATDMRARYAKDPAFRARVDAYWAGGGR